MAARDAIGVKANFPGFIAPALATATGHVPSGPGWIHEVKFDGYRAQIHIANEAIKIYTRRGHDWTHRFKKIAADAWHLNAKSAIIDGEVVAPSADGTTDFSVLQNELKSGRSSDKLAFYAFDLLYLNGRDLRREPLHVRKTALERLVRNTSIMLSQSFEVDGKKMLQHACKIGLEGIVSKKADAKYISDRTDYWVKMTCRQRETLPIVGYAMKEERFDGIYLARKTNGGLIYAGKVDHGFTPASSKELRSRLNRLGTQKKAFAKTERGQKAVWVKPLLLAEVEYRAKSAEGKLRHPSFKGLREDLERPQ